MQPYQEAAQRERHRGENAIGLIKGGAQAAMGFGLANASSRLLSRAIPLLSEYVPEDLAIKGISKINQKLGNFVKSAYSEGYDRDEIKGFIENKLQKGQAKEGRNLIEQYSPELFTFMKERISGGETPLQAAAVASVSGKFKEAIGKMQKDHKTGWGRIAETVFGTGQTAQPQPQQQQQQIPQGPGPGSQKLMQILQSINQRMGQQ